CEQRQREPPPLTELAQIELSPRFEPDDEEKERHQAAVDPLAQIEGNAVAAYVDREARPPEGVVGRRRDVHPDERRDGGREQDRGAAGLGAEELAERRLDAARPCGSPGGPGPAGAPGAATARSPQPPPTAGHRRRTGRGRP